MSADFWASYLSGAVGIIIGNRLDIIKTELQAGNRAFLPSRTLDANNSSRAERLTSLFRGAAAPVLGYGVFNSLLFMSYNRTLKILDPSIFDYTKLAGVDLGKIWMAGAVGGLACWVVSAPMELIKCRAQLMVDGQGSSYATFLNVYRRNGIRGLYLGGAITCVRDSFGFAWYFWSYELSKRMLLSRQPDPFVDPSATDVLAAGGIAGIVTWASVYHLDAIKTRIQTTSTLSPESRPLLSPSDGASKPKSSWAVARDIYRVEGIKGFYRGFWVCSLRAFIVNAVQGHEYVSSDT